MCIRNYLQNRHVRFGRSLLHRPAPVGSLRMAETVHRPGRTVGQGVLVRGPAGRSCWRCSPRRTGSTSDTRLGVILGVEDVRIATEPEVDHG